MEPKRRTIRREEPVDRAGSHNASCCPSIEALRQLFRTFRSQHQSWTQIPTELREAVLDALQNGAPQSHVLRACKISPQQVARWQQLHESGNEKKMRGVAHQDVRVFRVSDDVPQKELPRTVAEESEGLLELRLGQWTICLRQHRG